ncbi:MAG TPA: hypothetical protein VHV99_19770 [Paraburkholderia sp.]|nr:hypothetical protein [Paraburkholderia sp.]
MQQSLSSLDFTLAPEWVAPLDVVSESARPFPYYMFADGHQARIHGQVAGADKPTAYSSPVRIAAPNAQKTSTESAAFRAERGAFYLRKILQKVFPLVNEFAQSFVYK